VIKVEIGKFLAISPMVRFTVYQWTIGVCTRSGLPIDPPSGSVTHHCRKAPTRSLAGCVHIFSEASPRQAASIEYVVPLAVSSAAYPRSCRRPRLLTLRPPVDLTPTLADPASTLLWTRCPIHTPGPADSTLHARVLGGHITSEGMSPPRKRRGALCRSRLALTTVGPPTVHAITLDQLLSTVDSVTGYSAGGMRPRCCCSWALLISTSHPSAH
jgi:hypothetical protein